ncbi:endolytic transglycosylase MltG [Streptomonospora wellingtoniae]|uniref:Endolytic murein transglycosylase n=1 Tax=Streptomonospora wellingtoniae TaxID=3075544 RepID=A0ABU2KW66_9ACTN|nr:endolytic transglycosylase MltG [Streptomonospora sp. DSM 45055]MDT0303293.1 endolytic transglycosylase MltG [Streptomonospora sp. DSM 45055]
MSDRTPYDGGDHDRGRRGRRRAPDTDPLDDGRGGRPAAGPQGPAPYADPRTDPRRSTQARAGRVAEPRTDPWPHQGEAPGGPDYDTDRRPPRWEDVQAAQPRGRRHRDPADAGPATGPHSTLPPDGGAPRRRRSRSADEAEEHLAWSRPESGDADDDFRPAPPRTLDFDAVPVRRKRPRDDDPRDEGRGGRRRRSGDTGAFPTVPERGAEGSEDTQGADEGRPGRRRRSPESGSFPAVDESGAGSGDPYGDEPRGGRRRRRDDTAASTPPAPAEDEAPAPRRGRSRRETRGRPDGVPVGGEPVEAPSGAAQDREEAEEPAPRGRGPRRRRGREASPEDTGGRRRRRAASADDSPEPSDGDDGDDGRRPRRGARAGGGRGRKGRPAKQRNRRSRKGPVILLCVVLVAVLGAGGYVGRAYVFPPDYEGKGSGSVRVEVAEGSSGSSIARNLADKGVVASSQAFLNALNASEGSVAPGTYRLRERMSGEAAVAMLTDPATRIRAHVTFKEGLRSEEILTLISKKTDIPMKELRAAYENGDKLGLPDYAEYGAEGYLFPDTYDMPADADATALLKRMVDRFHTVAGEVKLEKKAEELNLTPNEAMSVAAVVQAESGSVEDMSKVARVVYNRLQQGMELGMDSTCFYVLGEYGIALTSAQVAECESSGSEYATYGRKGLPQGPIVSPGKDAINAALNPAEGDWRYFVATDPENGVTEFAETYDEFVQLKQEFEQNRGDA